MEQMEQEIMEILYEYNAENDTRIEYKDLDVDKILEEVYNLIWCQIEQYDI